MGKVKRTTYRVGLLTLYLYLILYHILRYVSSVRYNMVQTWIVLVYMWRKIVPITLADVSPPNCAPTKLVFTSLLNISFGALFKVIWICTKDLKLEMFSNSQFFSPRQVFRNTMFLLNSFIHSSYKAILWLPCTYIECQNRCIVVWHNSCQVNCL